MPVPPRARLLAGCLAALLLGACAEPEPPRSVLLISLDTTRADHLGVYGHSRDTTPHLDVLAGRGIVFDEVVAPSENTLISHATLFTGLTPVAHGATHAGDGQTLAPAVRTLAEDFQEAGFQTGGFVAHGDWLTAAYGMDRGFDTFTSSYRDAADVFADAEHWLGGLDPERPFFLFIHLFDVHSDPGPRPYEAPEGYAGLYTDDYTGPLADWDASPAKGSGFLKAAMDHDLPLTPADRQYLADMYDEGLRALDDELGAFFDRLEPYLDTTWVAVTADHGEEFGEHGAYLHSTFHEGVVHIPGILVPPRRDAGVLGPPRHVPEQIRLMDFRPTLVGLLGLEPAARAQGADLSGWLTGEASDSPAGPATVYHQVLRKDGFKLLRTKEGLRLYDLRRDKGERNDLSGVPEHAERLKAMQQELIDLQRRDTELGQLIQNEAPAAVPGLDAVDLERLEAIGYTR